ncbi:MAG TPA: DinB family protein [bacterium]|nr:DinB family protein [bacterium]
MDVREAIQYGLTATYARMLRAVEDVSDVEARQIRHDLSPLIWQLGHIALSDGGFLRLAGGMSPAPETFKGFFRTGSGGPADYPSLAEVRTIADAAQRDLMQVARLGELSQRVESRNYSTVGEMLIYAAYHRGYHVGKMTTLRALLGKPRMFG